MKIFLVGFMGCGKTYWGQKLSRKLQLPFFDLDQQIEEKEEKPITAIFGEEGEEYFRLLEKEVLYLLTESHESFVLAAGGGICVGAVSSAITIRLNRKLQILKNFEDRLYDTKEPSE